MAGLFARPDVAARIQLAGEPVLESWNAADHPDQLRLRAYLDVVAEQLGIADWPVQEQRTIELVVGLPRTVPLDHGGRDLDNYLYPLVRRLGASRIAAAFARKVHQPYSTIAAGHAVLDAEPAQPPPLTIRTSVSAQSTAWKQTVHQACSKLVAQPLPPGSVAIRIRLGVSRQRNWAALWKPTIDALGPLLGMPDPARPFRPDDDRVVDLELHRRIDETLRNDVLVEAWRHGPCDHLTTPAQSAANQVTALRPGDGAAPISASASR